MSSIHSPPDWLTDPTCRNVYQTISSWDAPHLAYEDWLQGWFGGAIASQSFPWFREQPEVRCHPVTANAHARRLFGNAGRDLEMFHDDQIGAALWLMMSDDDIYLCWPDVPIADRLATLNGMTGLFRDLFAERCMPRLSHGLTTGDPYDVLGGSCYMWWEYATHLYWPGDPDRDALLDAMWRVMEETLAIPHRAVQESALHGLGHAVFIDRARTEAIIDRWLETEPTLDPEILSYARCARGGCIQ